jgi:hypothetical protein
MDCRETPPVRCPARILRAVFRIGPQFNSNWLPQFIARMQENGHLAQRELETGFHGAERDADVGGDLALAHLPVVRELEGTLLGFGQPGHGVEQMPVSFAIEDVLANMAPGLAVLLHLLGEAILHVAVNLPPAEPVDGAPGNDGGDPAQGPAFVGMVTHRTTPDFEKDLLDEILGVGVVMKDLHAKSFEKHSVAGVELVEACLVLNLNQAHELFVA